MRPRQSVSATYLPRPVRVYYSTNTLQIYDEKSTPPNNFHKIFSTTRKYVLDGL